MPPIATDLIWEWEEKYIPYEQLCAKLEYNNALGLELAIPTKPNPTVSSTSNTTHNSRAGNTTNRAIADELIDWTNLVTDFALGLRTRIQSKFDQTLIEIQQWKSHHLFVKYTTHDCPTANIGSFYRLLRCLKHHCFQAHRAIKYLQVNMQHINLLSLKLGPHLPSQPDPIKLEQECAHFYKICSVVEQNLTILTPSSLIFVTDTATLGGVLFTISDKLENSQALRNSLQIDDPDAFFHSLDTLSFVPEQSLTDGPTSQLTTFLRTTLVLSALLLIGRITSQTNWSCINCCTLLLQRHNIDLPSLEQSSGLYLLQELLLYCRDEHYQIPLWYFKFLVAHGASLLENFELGYFQSSWHLLATTNCVDGLDYLGKLDRKIDIHRFDDNGHSVAFAALFTLNLSTVKTVLELYLSPINHSFTWITQLDTQVNFDPLIFLAKFGAFSLLLYLVSLAGWPPSLHFDKDGRSLLCYAAKADQLDCLHELINQLGAHHLEQPDEIYGWTPLMMAAASGHWKAVQTCKQLGACFDTRDKFGRTPLELAIYYGHFELAPILSSNNQPKIPPPSNEITKLTNIIPATNRPPTEPYSTILLFYPTQIESSQPSKNAFWNYEIVFKVNSKIKSSSSPSTKLLLWELCNRESPICLYSTEPIRWISLTIGSKTTPSKVFKRRILVDQLPNHHCSSGNLVSFDLELDKTIVQVHGKVLICTNILPASLNNSHGSKDNDSHYPAWPPLGKFVVIGHRGAGANKYIKGPWIEENTIESFAYSSDNVGIPAVEFDVHVTKDGIPIVYHDFLFTISDHHQGSIQIPITDLTLKDFISASYHPPFTISTDDIVCTAQNKKQATNNADPAHAKLVIKSKYPTLSNVFRKVPHNVAFDIEIKYPLVDEQIQFQMDRIPPIDWYCNQIIHLIDTEACAPSKDTNQPRHFIISSFHRNICTLVKIKRPHYNVYYLTEAGISFKSQHDKTCNSVEAAVKFCLEANLQGIIFDADVLVMIPHLIPFIKQTTGLRIFSYGTANNDIGKATLQKDYGIDGIIVDQVKRMVSLNELV